MRTVTKWFMLAVTVLVAIYATCARIVSPEATISDVALSFAYDWPTLPYAWGVVGGHLFWPGTSIWEEWMRGAVLILFSLLLLVYDIQHMNGIFPLWPMLGGVAVGHLLWPQGRKR